MFSTSTPPSIMPASNSFARHHPGPPPDATEVPFLFGLAPSDSAGARPLPIGVGRRQSTSLFESSSYNDTTPDYERLMELDDMSRLEAELPSPAPPVAAGFRALAPGSASMFSDYTGDPFFDACARGDVRLVDSLAQQQFVMKSNYFGTSPVESNATPLFSTPFGMDSIFARRPSRVALLDRTDMYGRTPLMAALFNGHGAVASYLIENGADVNARDKVGMSVLQYAVASRNPVSTRNVLEAGAEVNYQSPADGFSALLMAAMGGHDGVIQVLLEANADVNLANWKHETALMHVAHSGSEVAFRMLLSRGADVRAVSADDCSALTYAASRGKVAFCEALATAMQSQLGIVLPRAPGNIMTYAMPLEKAHATAPALHAAAAQGHLQVVALLISWGVSANLCRDASGATALMRAAEHGRRALVEWLIDAGGADPGAVDSHGDTALIYACRGSSEEVVRCLLQRRAVVDVESPHSGSPLLVSCSLGATGIVSLLLNHGAALDKPSSFRATTPLLTAAANGREECVRLLVLEARRRMLDLNVIINARDENGWTALMFLSGRGLHAGVYLLLTNGANPNIASISNGATALMLAATGGRINIVEMLLQCGANPFARTLNGKTAAEVARAQRLDKVARVIEGFSRAPTGNDDGLSLRFSALSSSGLKDSANPAGSVGSPFAPIPPSMLSLQSFLPSPAVSAAAIAAGANSLGSSPTTPHAMPTTGPSAAMLRRPRKSLNGTAPALPIGATSSSSAQAPQQDRRITAIGKITYNKSVRLGSGSHGTLVYEGFFGDVPAAIKRIPKVDSSLIIDAEIKLLQSMLEADKDGNTGSDHVVRYYGKEENDDFVFLAMERMHLTLQKLVHQCRSQLSQLRLYYSFAGMSSMDDAKLQQYAGPLYETVMWLPRAPSRELLRAVLLGVEFLHGNSIVHNDLKPGNILLTADHKVKIADMGLALALADNEQSFSFRSDESATAVPSGLGGFFAPEVLTGERKTIKVDVFAAGCLAYYILTGGFHPFESGGKLKREANIMDGVFDLTRLSAMPLAMDVVRSMIARDPEHRPTVDTVLAHPFFWSADDTLVAFGKLLNDSRLSCKELERQLGDELDGVQDWVLTLSAYVPRVDITKVMEEMGLSRDAASSPLGLLRFAVALGDKDRRPASYVKEAFAAAAAMAHANSTTMWTPFCELDSLVPCLITVLFEAFPRLPLVVHKCLTA